MAHLLDKDALLEEIERLFELWNLSKSNDGRVLMKTVRAFIDSFEVKDFETWHLQEKENIYDAMNDYSLHTFACIMKDGTIQKFNGICDEDFEGHINTHIYGVNDDYDNVDEIVKWIEFI
jgi:hypothetical protein